MRRAVVSAMPVAIVNVKPSSRDYPPAGVSYVPKELGETIFWPGRGLLPTLAVRDDYVLCSVRNLQFWRLGGII